MKSQISNFKFQILLLLALAGAVSAANLPIKPPAERYRTLWTNSPFTAKPPPPVDGPVENPLDDYSLIGVSSIGGNGHRVTLINKKKPEERITVDSDNPKASFKILGVTRKPGDPLGTVVSMQSGTMKGTVGFDGKLLTLVAAAPPKAPNPQLPPGAVPPNPNPNIPQNPNLPPGARLPRPRVVPPPTPQAAGPRVVPPPAPNSAGQPKPSQPTQPQIRPQRHGN